MSVSAVSRQIGEKSGRAHLGPVLRPHEPVARAPLRKMHIPASGEDVLGIEHPGAHVPRQRSERRVDEGCVRRGGEGGQEVEGEDDGGEDEEDEGEALE